MSDRAGLCADELARAMGGGELPATATREGRVQLLAEAADALVAGRTPSRESALFLAAGVLSWLEHGGDLARDFWRVTRPKSHHTPQFFYRQLMARRVHRDERQSVLGGFTVSSPPIDEGTK